MASGIARGRVRTTATTTESRNMAAILQIIGWQRHAALIYRVLLWYSTCMLWSIDTCENKESADQYHVTISPAQVFSSLRSRVFWSWQLTIYWFSIGSRAHVGLICRKQGRTVRKPVNASPRLKVIQIIIFLLLCFVYIYMVIIKLKTESQRINWKPHCKVTKLKSKYYFSWVSLIGHWTTRPRS